MIKIQALLPLTGYVSASFKETSAILAGFQIPFSAHIHFVVSSESSLHEDITRPLKRRTTKSTDLIVGVLLWAFIVSEILSERLHPGLTLLVLLVVVLVQLVLLPLAALPTRFGRRHSDFCGVVGGGGGGNKLTFKSLSSGLT